MKKHSKVGNKKGKPAYRTPSTFRSKKFLKITKETKKSLKNHEKKNLPIITNYQ